MRPCLPRVALALRTPVNQEEVSGVGVSTPCGAVSARGGHHFRPRFVGVVDLGIGPYLPRVALALRSPVWGFHTVRGGIDAEDHGFRPQFAGVVRVWQDFRSEGLTLSSRWSAGSTIPRMGFLVSPG